MKIFELKKTYGDFELDVQNLNFEQGLIHGLIGPNGCGKSTLAKLIAGIVPADRSELDLCGMTERDITLTSQKPYIMRDTVLDNLIYPLKLRNIRADEDKIAYWLGLCGLIEKKTAHARSLSSGQRQRLSLARAMIFEPKLVIIDENLSNLDLDGVETFEKEIQRIQKTAPATWIIVSHQLSHVQRLCDRVHFMDNGKMIKSGTVDEVLIDPQEPELIRYLKHESHI